MASYQPFTSSVDYTPLEHEQYIQSVIANIDFKEIDDGTKKVLQQMLYQSVSATGNPIVQYTRQYLLELTSHMNHTFQALTQEKKDLEDTIDILSQRYHELSEEYKQFRLQVNSLSGTSSGSTGRPKVA